MKLIRFRRLHREKWEIAFDERDLRLAQGVPQTVTLKGGWF